LRESSSAWLSYVFRSKERRTMIDTKLDISLNKQCKLLQISKSTLYYTPVKPFASPENIDILNAINNIYSDFPSYGVYKNDKATSKRWI